MQENRDMMTPDLFRAYREKPTDALRNQLVVEYLHIARMIALRFSGRGVEFDDLYQVASLALIKAVERFDPDYGVKFQSYATPKMVGEVKNYFRDKLHAMNMPRRGKQMSMQLDAARARLAQELLRQPTLDELVSYMGLPESDVIEALAFRGAMYPGSLDARAEEDDAPMGAFLGEEEKGFDQFELHDSIERALHTLPDMEQRVLRARFWGERSQRDVADEMGISQMTISRMERKALEKVRVLMAEA